MLDLARQVNDLLRSTGVAGQPVRMVVIGDRDYRTDAAWRRDRLALTRRAQVAPYRLDSPCGCGKPTRSRTTCSMSKRSPAPCIGKPPRWAWSGSCSGAGRFSAMRAFLRLRAWLQEQGLPLRIVDAEIIDAMAAVPDDVQKVLRELRRITNSARPTARRTHLDRYDKPPITRLTDDALRMARHSAANRSDRPSAASG